MSEPKTDTYDRMRKFMALHPNERDEALWLQMQRVKSMLESEGIVLSVRDLNEMMNGTKDKAGLSVRMEWMEVRVGKLVKSNAKLQAALYVCTGIWIAIKFYFEFIKKP